MTQKTLERTEETQLPSEVRFPTESYDRREFYKTLDNVRYMLKVNLVNGQQAENVPVGIEDLVEFLGDVEKLVSDIDNLNVQFRNHTHWTAKLNTGCDTIITSFDWECLEQSIENLAEEHGIALRKMVSLSGRGHESLGARCVGVSYSFGTYSNDEEWIENKNNPRSKVKWVGGEIGNKNDLNPSTVRIESVETHEPTLAHRIKCYLSSLF